MSWIKCHPCLRCVGDCKESAECEDYQEYLDAVIAHDPSVVAQSE